MFGFDVLGLGFCGLVLTLIAQGYMPYLPLGAL